MERIRRQKRIFENDVFNDIVHVKLEYLVSRRLRSMFPGLNFT